MANLLIVGGSGFIGSALARAALAAAHRVTLLNRGSRAIEGTEQLVADRNSPRTVAEALAGRAFDAVLDTTSCTDEQAQTLLQALGGKTRRAVMISSAAVYGDKAVPPYDESQPADGASVWGTYGANKSRAEESYLQAGLDYCAIVRPPYVFGTDNVADRETWFWTRQLGGRKILLPGNGQAPVQFVHKDDLAKAMVMLVESGRTGNDIFNVADPTILSLSQLASLLAEVAGVADRQVAVGELAGGAPARAWFPFGDYPCLASADRITRELGWSPGKSLKERFAQTFAGYSPVVLRDAYQPTEAEINIELALKASPLAMRV